MISKSIALVVVGLVLASGNHNRLVNYSFTNPLEAELAGVAQIIQRSLARTAIDTVDVGIFTPKSKDPKMASYGKRIAEALRSELSLAGLKIQSNAAVRIAGEFRFDSRTGEILITTELTDPQGEPINSIDTGPIPAKVLDHQEIMMIATVSAALDPQIRRQELAEIAEKSIQQKLDPPKIERRHGSDPLVTLPGLSIGVRLAKVNPKKHPFENGYLIEYISPTISEELSNQPVFRMNEKDYFAVELVNMDSQMHVAAELYLDGINVFALSELTYTDARGKNLPRHQHWAVMRGSQTLISGWFKNMKQVSAFQIVPDEDSVAARLGELHGLGTIQVLVRAAWEKGTEPPSGAFRLPTSRGIRDAESINIESKEIPLETGVIIGSLTVRYESKN